MVRRLQKWTLHTVAIGSSVFLLSCNMNSEFIDISKKHDFLKSEIINSGPTPADGQSSMNVTIHLKNKDRTPVPGFRPKYVISEGQGVITATCTESTADGASLCILKATVPGIKTLVVDNVKEIELKNELQFTPTPSNGSRAGLNAGSHTTSETSDGSKITAGVGFGASVYSKTFDGHQIFSQLEGTLSSD